jgi:amino acid adenylation domain-containing protein
MSLTPDQLARLSPEERRALLGRLLQARAAATRTLPASHNQRALWFLHQLAPDSPAYNESFAWRVRAGGDPALLRAAFQDLIDRHAMLRTTFARQPDGSVAQVVHGYRELACEVRDAAGWSDAEPRAALTAESRRPFDLERGPLLRLVLFRRSEAETVLQTTVHHIAVDLWSMMVTMGELQEVVTARLMGRRPDLPPAADYGEFVGWQAEMVVGPAGERHWDYWRRRLAAPPVLELPTDRPRPPVQTFDGRSYPFQLSPVLTARLKELARSERSTLYTVLLAAYQVLLARLSGQDDLLIGAQAAARTRPEFERVVGLFTNQLVLRADLSGNPPFTRFLARTKQGLLEALSHQDYPFSTLVERLHLRRDPSRSPLCDVSFTLQTPRPAGAARHGANGFAVQDQADPADAVAAVTLGGAQVELIPLDPEITKSDLGLEMVETGAALSGWFRYSTNLFDAATVGRIAARYERLLEEIVADPRRPIDDLDALPAAERRQVLVDWNDTARPFPADHCLHELFAAQAARTPEATAVESGAERLTFRELDDRTDRLAHRLRGLGVGPDALVGVCVERSPEMVVALLAVLKAGGAYLPLAASDPPARLAFLLRDSRAGLVLTQERHRGLFDGLGARVACLDAPHEGDHDGTPVAKAVTPDHLAYVIYTSGSTGLPKGVMLPNRAVVNYLAYCLSAYPAAEGAGSPVHSPLGFDLTVTSLWAPLLAGRPVRLLPEHTGPGSVEGLATALKAGGLGLVKLTPAHLVALGQLLPPEAARGAARALVIGGEALLGEDLAFWAEHAPDTRLINEYGPTEATVGCCVYEATSRPVPPGPVPIGRPIANARAYVLDRRLRPCPAGVPGELFVGGVGLARGYLGRPGLTAERFLPDPFGIPGGRLYRTGDRARWRADGLLEYLGRCDHQVKVRGYRIEPGEVEAALMRHPAVGQAAVLARGSSTADRRLVAYVVPREGHATPTAAELLSFLGEKLPDYMVPSTFVALEALPLTGNGKVDRDALPAGDGAETGSREPVAPRNAVEEVLLGLWSEVLGREGLGVEDSFFEVGGHSLLAMRLLARVRETFEVELPLSRLFVRPSVAGLAEVLLTEPGQRERVEKTAETLLQLADLSDDELKFMLADQAGEPGS